MGTPTKQEVIAYFKHDRTLTTGKILYNKLPTKSLATIRIFNAMSNIPENISRICYELGKQVGLSEREIVIYTQSAITKKEEKTITIVPKEPDLSSLLKALLSFDPEKADYHKDVKPLAKRLQVEKEIVFEDQKTETLVSGILSAAKKERYEQLKNIPDTVKKTIKLREQFPFLSEEDCPGVYKELVNDMITAYHKYTTAHSLLFEKSTQEELAEIAAVVKDNFLENKQIWEELEYYQKNKTSLGKHAVFLDIKFRQAMEELPTEQLSKVITNLKNKINRNKKKSEDTKRSEADCEKSTKLYKRQEEELIIAEEIFKTR